MKIKIAQLIFFTIIMNLSSQDVLKQDPYNITYEENVILLKVKNEVELGDVLAKSQGTMVTGITDLDYLFSKYKITSMDRLFKNVKEKSQQGFFKDYSGNEHEVGRLDKIYKLKYEEEIDAKELSEILNGVEEVEYAEPDYHFHANAVNPDDPLYTNGSQWHIDAVNAPAAWELTTGDTTQIIAIIDTGVDWLHPDLDDNIWRNWNEVPNNGIDDDNNGYIDDIRGWDFINNDNDPTDDNSHGTHVAGIAAAEGNNGVGITGINWHAKIMPVKMLQSSGSGNSSDLAEAITYASQNGATVINMSLGSYGESITVKIALENAYAYSVLVAAAGNDGFKVDPPYPPYPPYKPMYPGCYGFVIGVEASTTAGSRALFSNFDPSGPVAVGNKYGHNYEVRAPGVGIESTFPNGGYKAISGTSMASPIVAGAVSLMRIYAPNQSTEQIFAKLIQGANGGILDIKNSMTVDLQPYLSFVEYTIVDTLDGDGDGIADVGETIELYLTVKNAGGYADSVWSKIRFGEYEDQSVATILDSTSYIGDISAYGTMTGELDPFIIYIDPNVVNNRDIIFEYVLGFSQTSRVSGAIVPKIQNGVEFKGFISGKTVMRPDKYYIISENVVFDSLIINPGSIIRINDNCSIGVNYHISAIGKKDSLILFTANNNFWNQIINLSNEEQKFEYCIFEYSHGSQSDVVQSFIKGQNRLENCIIRYNHDALLFWYSNSIISKSVFTDNVRIKSLCFSLTNKFEYNLVIRNNIKERQNFSGHIPVASNSPNNINLIRNNSVYNNINYYSNKVKYSFGVYNGGWGVYSLSPNYFGTKNSIRAEELIEDYFENNDKPIITADSMLIQPSSLCHGHVWKVELNGIDPQDEHLDPLGSETVKFDVYFNRAMDTTVTPFLTFGVREPYTQHVVIDNASWSADSTVWTAYYTFGLETGDGVNTIRVQGARDDEYFEIPIEDSRFKFVLQAAGAASTEFIATAAIGKVNLEWPEPETSDLLGYNIYRFERLTDSTTTDTVRINSELITSTTFTDFNIIPDSTYYYAYKVLGTDMVESDFSKVVGAKPFNASKGDANGDLTVNVLDITTIVSYLLNQNPQPFLTDAADVNNDGFINVLDIVASVNIIMGNNIPKLIASEGDPTLYYDEKTTKIENAISISALYLKALVDVKEDYRLIPNELMERMEFGYNVVNDTLYLLVYNLNNNQLTKEEGSLFTLFNGKIKNIIEVTASDPLSNFMKLEVKSSEELIPKDYVLYQNYPNPFNPSTTIKYGLPKPSNVEITIYNILGQRIKTFILPEQTSGYHQVIWNSSNSYGRRVSTGVYIYQIKTDKWVDQKKMLLLK